MSSPKMKKKSLFAKLGVKGKDKEEVLNPEEQKDAAGEAPVADALDPSIEKVGEDGEVNKGKTEQPDVASTAKSKHSFLPTKKFNVSLRRITKPHTEEVHQAEDDAALNDARVDNEDAAVGSSKDWSVEIKVGNTAQDAEEEDSREKESSEGNEEENQDAEAEAVESSNPSEKPSDPPTNDGDINPPVDDIVDTNDKAKTKKKDDGEIDPSGLKTKFVKMFRRKQKSIKPAKKQSEAEVSKGYDTFEPLSIDDEGTNGGETARIETNDAEEKGTENKGIKDANIDKDDENIDPPALDANCPKMPPPDEISAKTTTRTSPTPKKEADGSRDGALDDADIIDEDIKETSDAKPSSNGAPKSSSLKSKFKKIFKSNASSAKVISSATAVTKETSEVKGCDITESKSDSLPNDVNDMPTSSDEKLIRSDAEKAASSKNSVSKNGDVAESESPPSNMQEGGDSTEQLDDDNNLEVIPPDLLVDMETISQNESSVKTEEAPVPCDNNAANAEKTIDMPQAKDDNNKSKDLNVLNDQVGDEKDNRTDEKKGAKNDDDSDNESEKDARKYEKHSRCGFGDGIHDALMHAGQLMYDTCGDPDFGTAKKMLGIMEIGENAMCHCLGTNPPDKDA